MLKHQARCLAWYLSYLKEGRKRRKEGGRGKGEWRKEEEGGRGRNRRMMGRNLGVKERGGKEQEGRRLGRSREEDLPLREKQRGGHGRQETAGSTPTFTHAPHKVNWLIS